MSSLAARLKPTALAYHGRSGLPSVTVLQRRLLSESPSSFEERRLSAPAYLLRTNGLNPEQMELRKHPFTPSAQRWQIPLGDKAGINKTGIHFCRLPAGNKSTTLHWHSTDDEWFFILEAGQDAIVDIMEDVGGDGLPESELVRHSIQRGDFLGFPAGPQNAHRFHAGDADLVYLCGGSREKVDITYYPELAKRLVINREGTTKAWSIKDIDVKPPQVDD